MSYLAYKSRITVKPPHQPNLESTFAWFLRKLLQHASESKGFLDQIQEISWKLGELTRRALQQVQEDAFFPEKPQAFLIIYFCWFISIYVNNAL